jgi:hypothetical protein
MPHVNLSLGEYKIEIIVGRFAHYGESKIHT